MPPAHRLAVSGGSSSSSAAAAAASASAAGAASPSAAATAAAARAASRGKQGVAACRHLCAGLVSARIQEALALASRRRVWWGAGGGLGTPDSPASGRFSGLASGTENFYGAGAAAKRYKYWVPNTTYKPNCSSPLGFRGSGQTAMSKPKKISTARGEVLTFKSPAEFVS